MTRKAERRKRTLAGICQNCPRPAIQGRARCERCRAVHRQSAKKLRRRIRDEVIVGLGGKCYLCGTTENLTIDHLDGQGARHVAENGLRNSADLQKWILRNNFPAGFGVLCAACNARKGTKSVDELPAKPEEPKAQATLFTLAAGGVR